MTPDNPQERLRALEGAAETPLDDLVSDALADMLTGNWLMLLRENGDFGASSNCPPAIVQEIARRALGEPQ